MHTMGYVGVIRKLSVETVAKFVEKVSTTSCKYRTMVEGKYGIEASGLLVGAEVLVAVHLLPPSDVPFFRYVKLPLSANK